MEHEGRNQHLNLHQQILALLMLVSTWSHTFIMIDILIFCCYFFFL